MRSMCFSVTDTIPFCDDVMTWGQVPHCWLSSPNDGFPSQEANNVELSFVEISLHTLFNKQSRRGVSSSHDANVMSAQCPGDDGKPWVIHYASKDYDWCRVTRKRIPVSINRPYYAQRHPKARCNSIYVLRFTDDESSWCMYNHNESHRLNVDARISNYHLGAKTKWSTFGRRHFKCIFWMKIYEFRLIFHYLNLIHICVTRPQQVHSIPNMRVCIWSFSTPWVVLCRMSFSITYIRIT